MKKAMVALALVAVVVFFLALNAFGGSFEQGLSEIRASEQKNGVTEGFLVPADKRSLEEYKNDLVFLKRKFSSSPALAELIGVKLGLVETEEKLFFLADEFGKINKLSPSCAPGGEVEMLKNKATEVKKSFNSVLAKRNSFVKSFPVESSKTTEVSAEAFQSTVQGANRGVDRIVEILDNQCMFN
ncbi:MAG: hypothetical protein Q7K34_01815 [archaeon]|nr:hypothetical protein [archaeon]